MLNKLSCKVIRFRAYHTTIIYHIWAWRKAEGIFRGVFVGYIFSFWPIALHAPLRSNSSNIARGHVDLLKLSDWGNRLRGFPVWEALKIFENYWKLMTSPNILISYIKYIYIYIPFEMSSLNGSSTCPFLGKLPEPWCSWSFTARLFPQQLDTITTCTNEMSTCNFWYHDLTFNVDSREVLFTRETSNWNGMWESYGNIFCHFLIVLHISCNSYLGVCSKIEDPKLHARKLFRYLKMIHNIYK